MSWMKTAYDKVAAAVQAVTLLAASLAPVAPRSSAQTLPNSVTVSWAASTTAVADICGYAVLFRPLPGIIGTAGTVQEAVVASNVTSVTLPFDFSSTTRTVYSILTYRLFHFDGWCCGE